MMSVAEKAKLVVENIARAGATPTAQDKAAMEVIVTELFTLSAALQGIERHLAVVASQLERLATGDMR